MNGKKLRCRRCRRAVGDAKCLVAAADSGPGPCCIWHMDVDNLPEWIWTSVQQAVWTSGKLNCFHCGSRLGGFSFLNRYRCPCGRDATVHFSRSRVDLDQKPRLLIVPPRRTGRGSAQAQQEEPALGPVCAGGAPQHGAAGDTDAPQLDSSVRREAELQAEPDHEVWSDAVPWESGAPAGLASLAPLASSSAAPQETDDVYFTSEGEAERQEEAVSSSQGPVVLSSLARIRLSKTDQNRLKSQRRKQRRRERWLQSQLQEEEEEEPSSPARPLAGEDVDRDGLTCAVCLDVFFRPRSCLPCAHVFCEPCLRRLARNRAAHTPCPLCRRLIANTGFHRELDHRAKTLFPKVWATRRQNFQNSPSARWPLPSSREQSRFLCCHGRSAEAAWRRWRLTQRPFDLSAQGLPQLPFATLIILFVISVVLLLYLAGFFFTLLT
ncbi:E3 ubiquitin-protein ligase RNF180-like isoform X1 [Poecilia latipinna]|uniref:E3 ubiquitin-protein ligase RNF180-like isoform X1 n=1 Tax=Poecilia latipinna TaxID=48699 RepID=UPI00072D9810|nr:PREDICTED: E3 ubiquitin-protein ligase RNF180-like isoform X1 [Poecilia latipinna]XP_014913972.1 PREDICTED: E3 ubiquitin-protein ligase RNF180-like isoform X1 [Poecilia latipinna]XP_014913973.1 PREDICTED: E3 ubiquitin-protein ligase RNF180-like isoform X1 [Poecilia latipinna]XP_014913974.1 PREDICTED: E3 ubiquitin-protein ligase RNF180-like isoform X1 [Poecilia latipinna]XP_014913975.1 PREDICTED: E3 ubiquitin-protein ligase RNF180-like isoform X1 [Poecilia latipinna]